MLSPIDFLSHLERLRPKQLRDSVYSGNGGGFIPKYASENNRSIVHGPFIAHENDTKQNLRGALKCERRLEACLCGATSSSRCIYLLELPPTADIPTHSPALSRNSTRPTRRV